MKLQETIQRRLEGLELRELAEDYRREAAVLIPIFERGGEPHFLLTLRTEEVKSHKGQVSFPGGMRQDGESFSETALRETFEEVGIASENIELLGRFHEYLSITHYRVVPFVGYLKCPFSTTPHAMEVAEIFSVPFGIFGGPSNLRVEKMKRFGRVMDVYFYRYGAREIWGLTACIIRDFLAEMDLLGSCAPQ